MPPRRSTRTPTAKGGSYACGSRARGTCSPPRSTRRCSKKRSRLRAFRQVFRGLGQYPRRGGGHPAPGDREHLLQVRVFEPFGLNQGAHRQVHNREGRGGGPDLAGRHHRRGNPGNMGNALSMVAAVKGYGMLVITPEGFSGERIAISQAYGAEVLQVGRFQADEAVERAREMGERAGYFFPAQFESEWNVEENRTILGPEILAQLPEGAVPDAVVAGVGTGGTLLGVGQA